MVLDHALDEDERVELWHGADAVVHLLLGDLDQHAILLLGGQRVQLVAGHPVVELDLGEGDALSLEEKREGETGEGKAMVVEERK